MRQNLTNVTETQLDRVDSFYVVGSTTKEGLIEGKSNVKIDLKKAISEGGNTGEITLAQAWTRAFKMDKMPTLDNAEGTISHSEESVPLPDLALCTKESAIYGIDYSGMRGIIDTSKTIEDEGIVIPENVRCLDTRIYELIGGVEQEEYKVVPFEELQESDIPAGSTYEGYVFFMYKLDKLSSNFSGSFLCIGPVNCYMGFRLEYYNNIYIIKYNGEYYFANGYEGD